MRAKKKIGKKKEYFKTLQNAKQPVTIPPIHYLFFIKHQGVKEGDKFLPSLIIQEPM